MTPVFAAKPQEGGPYCIYPKHKNEREGTDEVGTNLYER